MPAIVTNPETEACLRRLLKDEGYKLNRMRGHIYTMARYEKVY